MLLSPVLLLASSDIYSNRVVLDENGKHKNLDEIFILADSAQANIDAGKFEHLSEIVNQIKLVYDATEDPYALFFYHYFKGNYFYFNNDDIQAKQNFDYALDLAERIQDKYLLSYIYDDMGTFILDTESDYNMGLRYFFKALTASMQSKNKLQYSLVLGHVAAAYLLKEDPTGIKYANECYNQGVLNNDSFAQYMGAYYASCLYLTINDYHSAKDKALKAISINDKEQMDNITGIYSAYAYSLFMLGEKNKAKKYFDLALKNIAPSAIFSTILCKMYIGNSWLSVDKNKALEFYLSALDFSISKNNKYFRTTLYFNISQVYKDLGRYNKALEYYEKYHALKYNSLLAQNERHIQELAIKHDTNRALLKAALVEEKLLQKQKNIIIIISILVIIFLVAVFLLVIYLKKDRLYRSLTRSLLDSQAIKYNSSSLNNAKSEDLFIKVQQTLSDIPTLCDKELSLEKLANILNSNRTYISQIINEKMSMTFNAYINSLRIQEALKIISDENFSSPMKILADDLGYSSISTFYKAFNDITQMSPVVYRKQVVRIKKDKNITN